MLRPRVSLTSAAVARVPEVPRAAIAEIEDLDLSVQVADIHHHEDTHGGTLEIPTVLASVVREVIKEKAPEPPPDRSSASVLPVPVQDTILTPFVLEPVFSGADADLDSDANRTIVSMGCNNVRIKCDTALLGLGGDKIPVRIYLLGKDVDLPIDNQRCTVDVFQNDDGYTKKLGQLKRDPDGVLYVEVQHLSEEWQTGQGTGTIRFHIDTLFSLK